MSMQLRQFRSRRTGELEWFPPPYPARGDQNWEAMPARHGRHRPSGPP